MHLMIDDDIEFFEIFPWNEDFNTGIGVIDEQHRKLVDILNRLAAHLANLASAVILNDIFDELADYADYHFKTEEHIWAKHFKDDVWYSDHEQTHDSFIADIITLKENKEKKSLDDVIFDIISFLSQWLAYHILDTDKRMAKAVQMIESGISIEQAKSRADDEMNCSMKALISTVLSMYDNISIRTMDLMREKTLRKRAEKALHLSEERWDFILNGGLEDLWDLDIEHNSLQHHEDDDAITNIIGDSKKEKQKRSTIHPEDLEQVKSAFQAHLDGKTDSYTSKHRVLRENGSWSWVLSRGKVVSRDKSGKAQRMVGTHSDITERELAALIYQNSSQAMSISDAKNRIISVNPAFTTITGYTEDDVIGKDPRILSSRRHDKHFHRELWDTIKTEGHWSGEIWNQRKDGKIYAETLNINTIKGPDGKIDHYVSLFSDITQRKAMESSLQSSEEQYRNLVETVTDWVWEVDANGVYTYCSPRCLDLLGYRPEELLGKTPFDLMSEDEAARIGDEFSRCISTQQAIVALQNTNLHKDGTEVVLETNGVAILDETGELLGYRGIDRDITERKQSEIILKEKNDLLKESQRLTHIGNWKYDVMTRQLSWSDETYRVFEIDPKTPVTYELYMEITHPDDRERIKVTYWDSLQDHKPYSIIHRLLMKDGRIKIVTEQCETTFDANGEALVSIGTVQDITEREESRQALLDKEEIMIAQSRHAAMGEMIGMIAHQWRQPITVIAMGANNMLVDIELDSTSDEEIQKQSQNILRQTEYLSKTIDDFRNFFRPDKEVETVRLEDVMDEAQKIIGKSLDHSAIVLNITHQNGHAIKTYSRELLQVYINLLKNAKEALTEHRQKERRINVVISDDDEHVITTVCDNGGGIDEKILTRLFDPYFSTKEKQVGTGLGLYMSKIIIEKHLHGRIEVYNNKGLTETSGGACFKIILPIKWDTP